MASLKPSFLILVLITLTIATAPINLQISQVNNSKPMALQETSHITPLKTSKKVVSVVASPSKNVVHHEDKQKGAFNGFYPESITGTSPPSSGNWTISDVTVVEDEVLIVNGSIVIEYSGALVLKNSTIYMNLGSPGEHSIEVHGNLTVINSTITAYNTSNSYALKVYYGSKLLIENSEISYVGYKSLYLDTFGIWIHADNATIKNSYIHHNYYGIVVEKAQNVTIVNNVIENVSQIGIHFFESSKCLVGDNNISYVPTGVSIDTSGNITVTGNRIKFGKSGIELNSSYNNTISNNTITDMSWVGFNIDDSTNNTISNNFIANFTNYGIEVMEAPNNTFIGNHIIGGEYGMRFLESNGTQILENIVEDSSYYALRIKEMFHNTIKSNVFYNSGLWVDTSYYNTVENNTVNGKPLIYMEFVNDTSIENTSVGQIILVRSNNITISNLEISNTSVAIEIYETNLILIANSTFKNNKRVGVYLLYSNNATVINNVFENCGLFVWNSYNNTVVNNTVNGKPLIYLENTANMIVENAGQVIVVRSENITVKNVEISNVYSGIQIRETNYTRVTNVSLVENKRALTVFKANNITVTHSTFTRCEAGFYIELSINMTIIENTITENYMGIVMFSSNNISIIANEITDNSYGVTVLMSYGVYLTLNNFIDNSEEHVYATYASVTYHSQNPLLYRYGSNMYTGYMGNYWSDYTGTDADGDGIGETYYTVGDVNDTYPLVEPYQNYNVSILDNKPPEIETPQITPSEPKTNMDVKVEAEIIDGYIGVKNATLYYRVNSGAWHSVTMSFNTSNNLWWATIPGQSSGAQVDYYIMAFDNAENMAISQIYSYTVGDEVNPVIDIPQLSPSEPIEGENVQVCVSVSDDYSGVKNVTLYYSVNDGPWQAVLMSYNSTSGLWSGIIPGQTVGSQVKYYIVAYDNAGNRAVSQTYEYTVKDATAPTIDTPSITPVHPGTNESVLVEVRVDDNYSGVKNVTLYYSTQDGDWHFISMKYNSNNGSWWGVIPGQPSGTIVKYYIEAYDNEGNRGVTGEYMYEVLDTAAPTIGEPQHEPSEPGTNVEVIVTVSVEDDYSGVKTVTLYYNIDNGTWEAVPMSLNTSSGLWWGVIPGQASGSQVRYYFIAYDNAGNSASSPIYMYVVRDTKEPTIGSPQIAPEKPKDKENVIVKVSVEDDFSGVKNVTLYYSVGNETWVAVIMSYNASSGLWWGVIPGQPSGSQVKYYIVAYDNAGNRAETEEFSYKVTGEALPGFNYLLGISIVLILIVALAVVVFVVRRR
ncbi:MAG: right-handed parallel beta-helix repeat-containing protein [Candidatus Njordarchaeia archaeon]